MQKFRSFISIPITPEIIGGAKQIIKKLKPLDEGIKWVPVDNLHLTLKFLGDVDNVEIPSVCQTIRTATQPIEPFALNFHGTGGLPNRDRPRIIYAGVDDPTGQLVALVTDLETKMADLGFKPEPRDYKPHLTLGRTRSRAGRVNESLLDALTELGDIKLGDMVVDEVQLMASFLDKDGPNYQVMDHIEL